MPRPAFSRSPRASLFGKRDVAKSTKVSFETAQRMAARLNKLHEETGTVMSESEFIATVIEEKLYGRHEVERVQRDRLLAVLGKADE